jgi:hypothetical protein
VAIKRPNKAQLQSHKCLFCGSNHKSVNTNKTSNQTYRSGSYRFQGLNGRMDMGQLQEGWRPESPSPVIAWTQKNEKYCSQVLTQYHHIYIIHNQYFINGVGFVQYSTAPSSALHKLNNYYVTQMCKRLEFSTIPPSYPSKEVITTRLPEMKTRINKFIPIQLTHKTSQ